jgi:hypothetical protein
MGTALVGGGYLAWLLVPFVLSSELDGHVKGMVVAALGATPLATKILASYPKKKTVKEIHRKATQIAPAYNKGALQYLPLKLGE